MAGHSFDRGKAGYVNLLPPGKLGALVGDSAPMLAARRRFLDAGYYSFLANALVLTARRSGDGHSPRILDVGCGEGYYTHRVATGLTATEVVGTDVSKAAIQLMARRYPEIQAVVADTNRLLPVQSHSIDLLINIFAPRNPAEFNRVLSPRGRLLIVVPGPNHLAAVREALPLLSMQPGKQAEVARQLAPSFRLLTTEHLEHTLQLDAAAVADVVAMTPNARHVTVESPTAVTTMAQFAIMEFAPHS